MKNFKNYKAEKYSDPSYKQIEEGIYLTKDPYDIGEDIYVTSLTFEQEPESYGEEDGCPQHISQIPFEDMLGYFLVAVTDFYEELNENSEVICYQEFGSFSVEGLRRFRTIIGKRVYAKLYEEDGEEYYKLAIE